MQGGANSDKLKRGDDLIVENLDLVQHVVNQVASRYPRHVDRQELWNAGACGLVEAGRRYNPEIGVAFARYASTRIRGAIIDSTRSRDWAARTVRRGLRDMSKAEEAFHESTGRKASDSELADVLGITIDDLRKRRAAEVSSSLLHLDFQYPDQDSLGAGLPEKDRRVLPEEALNQREMLGTLRTAIEHLPPAQRDLVERYYLQGEMLQSIADSLGVTEARASQICSEGVNAMRAFMGMLYDGVPEVPESAPGKRNRAAYLSMVGTQSTWRSRLDAADHENEDVRADTGA